jgi:hypothetical protein
MQAKAREANSFAMMNNQVSIILGEYTDLPFYLPDPKQNLCKAINKISIQYFDQPNNMIFCIWAHPATHLQLQKPNLNSWKKQQSKI